MNTEKEFIKAFNNGYVLAEHEPKLLNTVSKNLNPSNNYLEGFLLGKKEYEQEYCKKTMNDLQLLRNQTKSRYFDIGREE